MGNCCQPPLSARNTEVDMTKPSDSGMPEKDASKTPTQAIEKNRDITRNAGSARKLFSEDRQRDTGSLDPNHQMLRKEKKIGNIIQIEKDMIHENIDKLGRQVDAKVREFLNNAFKKHFALANLSEDEKYVRE